MAPRARDKHSAKQADKLALRKAVSQAVADRAQYACTHGQGKCLRWEWDDADQYWTIPAGTCDCNTCTHFLDQDAHALTLASLLKNVKMAGK